MVWRHKHNLKGSDYDMTENFPAEIEHRRKLLYPVISTAKKMVNKANINYDH